VRPAEPGRTGDFSGLLARTLGAVDAAQKQADEGVQAFVAGETEDLHEIMIQLEQAQVGLQLMIEIRNRIVETYQELMRMPL
jgi:flagellar hook-basal body complex protein FliE